MDNPILPFNSANKRMMFFQVLTTKDPHITKHPSKLFQLYNRYQQELKR